MAIEFQCDCGKALRAKDEYAGKKTKCSECGAIVVIPAVAAARPPSSKSTSKAAKPAPKATKPAPKATKPASKAAKPAARPAAPAPSAGNSLADFLDEELGKSAVPPVVVGGCPNCRIAMPPGAILCIHCGYNVKTRKVIKRETS